MTSAESLFWLAAAAVTYTFAGYPILLWALTLWRRRAAPAAKQLPSLSLIISVHNEEDVLPMKVENALTLEYPRDRFDIIVASDGSTDRTNEIAARFAGAGVRLFAVPRQQGKTLTLNDAVRMAKGEVVVFTDANAMFSHAALLHLVRNFADPRIGFVTGWTLYRASRGSATSQSARSYGLLETQIKYMESLLHSCVGADGAIFAIRKVLYETLAAADINDLVIPLRIIRRGYRGVLEKQAVCEETAEARTDRELSRQIRIHTRTIRAMLSHAALLNPFAYGWFSLSLFSHKLLRLILPFLLLLLLATSAVLAAQGQPYQAVLELQALFYGLAGIGWTMKNAPGLMKYLKLPFSFVMVNWAIVVAWGRVLAGKKDEMWAPARRVSA